MEIEHYTVTLDQEGGDFYAISLRDGRRIVNGVLMTEEELRQLYNLLLIEFACK